jgi:hypothetical protein
MFVADILVLVAAKVTISNSRRGAAIRRLGSTAQRKREVSPRVFGTCTKGIRVHLRLASASPHETLDWLVGCVL